MGVPLNHPIEGAVNWAGSIGANWTTLQSQYVARDASSTTEVTVTGTTSETLLMTATVPANSLAAGVVMPVWAGGSVFIPASTTPTITWRLRWGGLTGVVLVSIPFQPASSGTMLSLGWTADIRVFTASSGTSGTVDTEGWLMPGSQILTVLTTSLTTIDTTTSKTLAWTIQTTDTNDEITQDQLVTNLG
jgi:hypothetical protein